MGPLKVPPLSSVALKVKAGSLNMVFMVVQVAEGCILLEGRKPIAKRGSVTLSVKGLRNGNFEEGVGVSHGCRCKGIEKGSGDVVAESQVLELL